MNRIDTDTQEDEEKKDKYKNIIQEKRNSKVEWKDTQEDINTGTNFNLI